MVISKGGLVLKYQLEKFPSANTLEGEAFGYLGASKGYKVLKCPECGRIFAVTEQDARRCPRCSHSSSKVQTYNYDDSVAKYSCTYQKLHEMQMALLILFLASLVIAAIVADEGGMLSLITGGLSSIGLIGWILFWGVLKSSDRPEQFRQRAMDILQQDIASAINEVKEKEYQVKTKELTNEQKKEVISTFSGYSFYVYKEQDNLVFFPIIDTFSNYGAGVIQSQKEIVPIRNIDFFEQSGSIRHETKVSGGNSGVGGAALGYWLAGPLGAALMANPTEVHSEEIKHDERNVSIQYTKDGRTTQLAFPLENYAVFKTLIPEKEKCVRTETVNTANEETDVFDVLGKLSKLKEQGILTEDEFRQKKAELLKKM